MEQLKIYHSPNLILVLFFDILNYTLCVELYCVIRKGFAEEIKTTARMKNQKEKRKEKKKKKKTDLTK